MKIRQKLLLMSLLSIFILFAMLVKTDAIVTFDQIVYDCIIYLQTEELTIFFKMVSHLVHILVIIIIILGLFLIQKKLGLFTIAYVVCNSVLGQAIKFTFTRARPNIQQLIPINGYSFPSAHAMMAMALYGFLFWCVSQSKLSKKIKWIFMSLCVIIIILIGMSRIYLGVHYASDVLAGYTISLFYVYCITYYLKKCKITLF